MRSFVTEAPEGRDRHTVGGSQLRSRADAFTPDGHLARSDERELAVAMEHLDNLLRAATALLGASGHRASVGTCDAAGCLLCDISDGPTLCALAHELVGERSAPATTSAALQFAVAQFRAALPDAMDAVRACRQRAHPSGTCWFSPDEADRDTCGAVLRATHELC